MGMILGAGGHEALLGLSGKWLKSLREDISREKRWPKTGDSEIDRRVEVRLRETMWGVPCGACQRRVWATGPKRGEGQGRAR